MHIPHVEKLALKLMTKYELWGWELKFFNRHTAYAGRCKHNSQVIELDRPAMFLNTEAQVRHVVLHEIAHALVGFSHFHDEVWRAKALEIGCDDPTPCVSEGFVCAPPPPNRRRPRLVKRYIIGGE